MALNGSLDDYSPAGALRVLSSTGKTGAVRFSGDAGCTVYLHEGQLYFARDERTDEALAAALVRPGRLTADQWSAAIDEAADQPRVGELLVEQGAIGGDLLASVVLSVVYDPLIRLFREADGQFEFAPDTVHWIGPFRSFNVDAIVAEVRRRVREADEMSPIIPSVDAWVTVERALPGNAPQVTLLREDWELVTACQGPRTVAELAHDLGRGQYSTMRVVYRLAQAGLVQVQPETVSPVPAPIEPAWDDRSELAWTDRTDTVVEPARADEDVAPIVAHEAPADAPEEIEQDFSHFAPFAEEVEADYAQFTPFTPDEQQADDSDNEPVEAAVDAAVSMALESLFTDEPAEPEPFDSTTFDSSTFDEPAADAGFDGELDDAQFEETFQRAFGNGDFGALDGFDGDAGDHPDTDIFSRDPFAPALPRRTPGDDAMGGGDLPRRHAGSVVTDHDDTSAVSYTESARTAGADEDEADATTEDGKNPNAVWLESLYAQFIDEPENTTKKRKKEAIEVAFDAEEMAHDEKVGTLRRLLGAIKKL